MQEKDWYKGETNVKERDRCGRETGVQEKNISAVGRARSTLRVLLVVGDQRGSMGSSSGCYRKPCAQNLERPKLKTSEFRVRKVLLLEKAPAEEIGDLMVPRIHLACLE